MSAEDFVGLMWSQACDALQRAERLQRQFFQPGRCGAKHAWQPPVDLFETEWGLLVRAAIPDAQCTDFQVHLESTTLRLTGCTTLPAAAKKSLVHRLEIPFGFIERVVALPEGHFEVADYCCADGCLEIRLRRIAAGTGA